MSSRHRAQRRFPGAAVIAAGVAGVVVLGVGWVGYRRLSADSCTGQVRLSIAVAPQLASAVRASAVRWARDNNAADGVCVAVDVTDSESSDVAAAVAAQHGVRLTGLGEATRTTAVPDVWLPDSSAWVFRLRAVAPGFRPTDGASIARNPVVVAVPEPVARDLNWLNAKLTWADVLGRITAPGGVRVGVVTPVRDAASLSGLLSLGAAAATQPNAEELTTAALRSAAAGGSAVRQDLLAKFPQSSDPALVGSALAAAVLSEADVIRYNAARPPVPLSALYLDPAPSTLDYPFAVMPGIDPVKAAAAANLRRALGSTGFRDALGGLGLRAPDGTYGAGFTAPAGAPGPAAFASTGGARDGGAGGPDVAAVDKVLATWIVVTGPARMLAVIDVSATMLRPVPTAGNASRIDLTVRTAQRGLGLLDDTWSLGLWVFSARLDGIKDHRELVPIGLLSTRRRQLLTALSTIRADRHSNTGLYDTVLAAYQSVQNDWVAGQANSVVLFTDGDGNFDPEGGLSEAALLKRLKEIADPDRPVQVVLIGIGNDVDQAELKRIAAATGGSSFVAQDPAKIGEIFLKAVALRPVTPR